MTHFCCHDANMFCCSCPSVQDGLEVDTIRIERYITLLEDNEEILRNMRNLSNFNRVAGNMSVDPPFDGPLVPLLP